MLATLAALAVGLAACSSSDGGPSQAELDAAEAARMAAEAEAEAARQAAEEAAAAAARAAEEARQALIAEQEKAAVMDAVAAAEASVAALMDDSSDTDVAGAKADIAAATAAIAAATTLSAADMAMYNAQVTAVQASLALAEANIRAYRAEMAANEANQAATAADRAKTAVEDAIAALNAAETAEDMAEAANVIALAAVTAAQTAVTNAADSDALAQASAALAAALMDASTAAADLGVKTQAVADATSALEMARATLAEVDPDHVALQAANAALAQAATDAQEQADRIKELEDTIAALRQAEQDRQDAAEAAAEKERMMQMVADGKALLAALGSDPLGHTSAVALADTGLTITPGDRADDGTITAGTAFPELKAVEGSEGMAGDWGGMSYSHTNPGTKVTNQAMVYTNADADMSKPFADEYGTGNPSASDGTYDADNRRLTITVAEAAVAGKVKSSRFPTAGSLNYPPDADGGSEVSFDGEYDGAAGKFLCTSANDSNGCAATYGSSGITLTGTWIFTHVGGATVSRPDDNYLYFGWWLQTNEDGAVEASAFRGLVGTAPATVDVSAATFEGTATYTGSAAGKFAIYNPLDSSGSAGHFTADATLMAKFGPNAAPNNGGITGTIDNFMSNGESMPWSVELERAQWGTDGAFASIPDDTTTADVDETTGTVWSIDGNSAAMSGNWSGQMYDDATSAATTADDDGSNVPTTVIGTFQSSFGSIGQMVGGFGAER